VLRLSVLVQLHAHEVRSAYKKISRIEGVRSANRIC
jgi:hypothetical protein